MPVTSGGGEGGGRARARSPKVIPNEYKPKPRQVQTDGHCVVGTSVQWVGDSWLHQATWTGFPMGLRACARTGMGEQ